MTLQSQQNDLLFELSQTPYWRVRGGWRQQGGEKKIRVRTHIPLVDRGYIEVSYKSSVPCLKLTHNGRVYVAALTKERERRYVLS